MSAPLWRSRPATPADLGYVWRTLAAQLARRDARRWHEAPWAALPAELIVRRELTVARSLLAQAHCAVAAPAAAESAHLVCGFVVFDPLISTVHYVYTARNLRRLGIARDLLGAVLQPENAWEVVYASHVSKAGSALAARLKLTPRFDPYRAFFSRDHFLRAHGGDSQPGGSRVEGQSSARQRAGQRGGEADA